MKELRKMHKHIDREHESRKLAPLIERLNRQLISAGQENITGRGLKADLSQCSIVLVRKAHLKFIDRC